MANNWKSRECCTECGEYNVNCTCDDEDEFRESEPTLSKILAKDICG